METVSKNSSGTCLILKEGKEYLGITTGLPGEILKTTSKTDLLSDEGYLFSNGRITNWPLEGIINFKDEIIPYGTYIRGNTIADISMGLEHLFDIALFFSKLLEISKLPDIFTTTGFYFTDEGSIILFPGSLLNLVYSHQEDTYNLEFTEPYNHPELKEEKAVCFTLGVLAYKFATGILPFHGESITETRELMRRSKPVPPEYITPGTRKDFSDLIVKSLSPGGKNNVTLQNWISTLKSLSSSGFRKKLSDKEAVKFKEKGQFLLKSREKKFKRSIFFQNNWKKLAITALITIILGAFISTPLSRALKGPVTRGMPSLEVVKLYYESINSLDSETLDDCTTGKAGKSDSREVTGLFVISRVRQGYEGSSGLVNAAEWIKKGKPPLKEGENLYGLSNLKITSLSIDTFKVAYDRWTTEFPASDDKNSKKTGLPLKIHTEDYVHLIKKKDTWFIDSIKRTVN